ncbi:hypothetical protein [Methyloprofundus sp.]|uniref:hypothetical protein n=1 Tax=Methyloprofundus sp. TaxID=2020875 RepID=UPI003D0B8383
MRKISIILFTMLWAVAFKPGFSAELQVEPVVDILSRTVHNKTAYIPPQCYTKTEDDQGNIHNPCFACHTTARRPNYINDADLQQNYSFADTARNNPWLNLFKDRTAAVAQITDQEITQYTNSSNYFDEQGRITLQQKLQQVPANWDYDQNGQWDGFTPDVWFKFDDQGFDHDPSGKLTGWRAFGYYPYFGTFWPTNGSTDDVLIRLADAFQTDSKGKVDLTVYKVNLAIVEAMLKEQDISIDPVDEAKLDNVDLDKDGRIGIATKIRYDWAPVKQRFMWYVGQAHAEQKAGKLHLAAGLYPEGTEFLHTVRYIDVDTQGNNGLSARMKEVRYARKRLWVDYSKLQEKALAEIKEKDDFPNRLRTFRGNAEAGISNGQGWAYAAFIEDAKGELRPQNYEELVFCAGCHSGVGAIKDGIFSFQRKLPVASHQQGWFHWSQKGLKGIAEPRRKDGQYEYSYYLQHNKSANEFRTNKEVQQRFFDPQQALKPVMIEQLHQDISLLLYASAQRALLLNKAYRVIVQEQSFTQGRDATILPIDNVHRQLKQDQSTEVKQPLFFMPLLLDSGAGFIKSNLDLFLPAVDINGASFWAEFSYTNTKQLEWTLKTLEANNKPANREVSAKLSGPYDISIPVITDGQLCYAVELSYSGRRGDQFYWSLKSYQPIEE